MKTRTLKIIITPGSTLSLQKAIENGFRIEESMIHILNFSKDFRLPHLSIFSLDPFKHKSILPSFLFHDDDNIMVNILLEFIEFILSERPIGSMDLAEKINLTFSFFNYTLSNIKLESKLSKNKDSYFFTFKEDGCKKSMEIHYYNE